jgi:hypothetical protein
VLQPVFLHGPGAGGCADACTQQRRYFPPTKIPEKVNNALIEEFVAGL